MHDMAEVGAMVLPEVFSPASVLDQLAEYFRRTGKLDLWTTSSIMLSAKIFELDWKQGGFTVERRNDPTFPGLQVLAEMLYRRKLPIRI